MGNMFRCTLKSGGASGTEIPLIVTCDSSFAGLTITATDGTTTLTQTCPSTSPYTVQFDLPNTGSWTVSATHSGQVFSTSVLVDDFEADLNAIPEGSTVTPTDNIQIWLHCAGVFDKNYTTISEVLADTTLVTTLIASNNAVDYMARSTSWASDVTADSSTMTKIGADDYCADKLLADSTWLNAICNSTYFESVLNVKVPTMTSDTTPSGVASASAYASGHEPYTAFNGNDSSAGWGAGNQETTGHVQYEFPEIHNIRKAKFYRRDGAGRTVDMSSCIYDLKATNTPSDSSSFVSLGRFNAITYNQAYFLIATNANKYKYFRLDCSVISSYNLSAADGIHLQLYGR